LADCVDAKIEPGRASVTVRLTVADSETGESLRCSSGYAEDFSYKDNRPNGDKAVYKAIPRLSTLYALVYPAKMTRAHTCQVCSRTTANNAKPHAVLIDQTTTELKRLGWSTERGRLYLQENFGKSSRQSLSEQSCEHF